jgi:AMP nucleosidase
MIGHCGGLRPSQAIGDYVLAHAYLRDDHVLDAVLPPEIPIPPIAEVQVALQRAAEIVIGRDRGRAEAAAAHRHGGHHRRPQLGAPLHLLGAAVQPEPRGRHRHGERDHRGAGLPLRVPYGTLLCVSDKPLHGEIKLPGQANRFYEGSISEHLRIGIATVDLLRQEGPRLHSRKLRAFDEPPFR